MDFIDQKLFKGYAYTQNILIFLIQAYKHFISKGDGK